MLSASSVVLAVLAVLYSLWSADIRRALSTKEGTEDMARQRRELRIVAVTKAVPLSIYSVLTTLIFLPPVIGVLQDCFSAIASLGSARYQYDPLRAALALTWMGIALLALVVGAQAWRLVIMWKRWRPKTSFGRVENGDTHGRH